MLRGGLNGKRVGGLTVHTPSDGFMRLHNRFAVSVHIT
jgi:hypothetical protein